MIQFWKIFAFSRFGASARTAMLSIHSPKPSFG